LELDHRDLALLLNDSLRRLLHDTLGWQNAADHHAIEPHGMFCFSISLPWTSRAMASCSFALVVGSVVN